MTRNLKKVEDYVTYDKVEKDSPRLTILSRKVTTTKSRAEVIAVNTWRVLRDVLLDSDVSHTKIEVGQKATRRDSVVTFKLVWHISTPVHHRG